MPVTWSERQKERGIKLNLTWFAPRSCWKKKIDGKPIYFKQANSADGYQAALLELAQRQKGIQGDTDGGYTDQWGEWTHSPGMSPTRGDVLNRMIAADPAFADQAVSIITGNPAVKTETVGQWIDKFLDHKLSQARGGDRAIGTWDELRKDLVFVERHFKATFPIKMLTGDKVEEYYNGLSKLTGRGGKRLSGIRKNNLYRSFKQWINYVWLRGEDQLPASAYKMTKNKDLSFDTTAEVDGDLLFEPAEIAQARAISPRWNAIVLLMANCGFGQIDCARLTVKKIKGDRLTWKRQKTRRRVRTPTIKYKLWPETVNALQPFLTGKGPDDLVFTTDRGTSMLPDNVVERDGGLVRRKWDNIGNQWAKLQHPGKDRSGKAKVALKPLKYLRKTGRNVLTRKLEFLNNFIPDLFLGHAPMTMGQSHYDAINGHVYPPLDEGTDYIRGVLLG